MEVIGLFMIFQKSSLSFIGTDLPQAWYIQGLA